MKIFITLTKYNTFQRREEGKRLLVVYYLINIFRPPLIIVSNVFMKNGPNLSMFIVTVYNTFVVSKLGRFKIDMVLMYLVASLLR